MELPVNKRYDLAYGQSGQASQEAKAVGLHDRTLETLKRLAVVTRQSEDVLSRLRGPRPSPVGQAEAKTPEMPSVERIFGCIENQLCELETVIRHIANCIG